MFSEKIQELIITLLGIPGFALLILSGVIIFLIIKIKNMYARLFILSITLIFIYFIITHDIKNDTIQTNREQNSINENCCYVTNIKTDLSVRLEPTSSNDTNIIDKLYLNTKNIKLLHVRKNANKNIWYEIEYKKNLISQTGWVFGNYLTSTYGKYHLKKEYGGASVRKNPSVNSSREGFILKNEHSIIVIDTYRNKETSKTWFKIFHTDDSNSEIKGWISGKILEIDKD